MGATGNSPGPFLVHPVHCRLVPAEPPLLAQRWEDQRAGDGLPQAQTTLHTGENRMMDKLLLLLVKVSNPLQATAGGWTPSQHWAAPSVID